MPKRERLRKSDIEVENHGSLMPLRASLAMRGTSRKGCSTTVCTSSSRFRQGSREEHGAMKYRIEIACDNVAFWNEDDHEPALEVITILRRLVRLNERSAPELQTGSIMDSNGNTVGKAEVIE